MSYEEDDDEDPGDWEYPDQADADDDEDSVDTDPCPNCGKPVYEQAEICPHCRKYISGEDSRSPRKPIWIILGAIISLIAILVAWLIFRQI
jgi:predicted nucleic acid-binding Zn ribbon protein